MTTASLETPARDDSGDVAARQYRHPPSHHAPRSPVCSRAVSTLKAKDVMSAALATVRASSKLGTAVDILRTLEVRHLPVVDDGGALVGLLSDRDLRTLRIPYFAGNEYVGDLGAALGANVSRLLRGSVPFVDTDNTVGEVLDLMIYHEICAIPVVDAERLLVGIISYVDLLRALSCAVGLTE